MRPPIFPISINRHPSSKSPCVSPSANPSPPLVSDKSCFFMFFFARLSKLRHSGRCSMSSAWGMPSRSALGSCSTIQRLAEQVIEKKKKKKKLGNRWVSTKRFNLSQYKMPGYRWVRYSGARYVVPGMVTVGHDLDGACLVVGRAHHQGDILPAKAKPEHGVAYVAYAGTEIMKHDFEVLMPREFQWVPSRNGHIPPGAVDGGRTSDGEPLYVGRTIHNGVPCVGKVHPSHGSLYIPYNGQELPFREYEVLVQH